MDARSRVRNCASRRDFGTTVVWLQLEFKSFGTRPAARCGGPQQGRAFSCSSHAPFYVCLLAISILYRTYPKDREQARSEEREMTLMCHQHGLLWTRFEPIHWFSIQRPGTEECRLDPRVRLNRQIFCRWLQKTLPVRNRLGILWSSFQLLYKRITYQYFTFLDEIES